MRVPDGEARISRLSLLLHSGDSVLGVLMRTVTMQGWPYAQEKLEGVAKIIAVIAVETIGAIIEGNLRSETDINAGPVR